MTRTSYIKPNSHTQKVAKESETVVERILERYHISFEQWLHILFETGCRFVEARHRNPEYRMEMLTNQRRQFWDKWMVMFIEDDRVMLASPEDYSGDYAELKKVMENPFA